MCKLNKNFEKNNLSMKKTPLKTILHEWNIAWWQEKCLHTQSMCLIFSKISNNCIPHHKFNTWNCPEQKN